MCIIINDEIWKTYNEMTNMYKWQICINDKNVYMKKWFQKNVCITYYKRNTDQHHKHKVNVNNGNNKHKTTQEQNGSNKGNTMYI